MFKRIILEDWQNLVPVISFTVTAAIFFIAIIRALLMNRDRAERLARLPLESPQENANRTH